LSINKYTFFKIFGKFYYRTVSKKQLIPANRSAYENIILLAELIIFYAPPYGFPWGLVNFATVHPKPGRKSKAYRRSA